MAQLNNLLLSESIFVAVFLVCYVLFLHLSFPVVLIVLSSCVVWGKLTPVVLCFSEHVGFAGKSFVSFRHLSIMSTVVIVNSGACDDPQSGVII